MTFMTALSLASAAGLNAYIPLLVFGLLARFTTRVELPAEFQWLTHPVLLSVVAVLLLVEVIADKIPAIDSINDAIQTVIRPTSGGIMFGSATAIDGTGEINWWAVGIGVTVALAVHLAKAASRPAVNAGTLGTGAVVASTMEDGASLSLSLLAVFAPLVAFVVLVAVIAGLIWLVIRVRSRVVQAR